MSPARLGFDEARAYLFDQLERLSASPLPQGDHVAVLRFKVPILSYDPLTWIESQEDPHKVYVTSKQPPLQSAGVGAALEVVEAGWSGFQGAWQKVKELIDAPDGVMVYAGMSFGRTLNGIEWEGMGALRFVVPAVEMVKDAHGCWLAVNVVPAPQGPGPRPALDVLRRMRLLERAVPQEMVPVSREDMPDFEDWTVGVETAEEAFSSGDIEKVVLARRVSLEVGAGASSESVLRRILATDPSQDGYLLTCAGKSFFGRSSRALFIRQGSQVSTHVDVEAEEYRAVAGAMVEVYRELCRTYQVDAQPLADGAPAPGRQRITVSGVYDDAVTDREFILAMTPSPDVCGIPAEKARHFIEAHEIFDRGWSSGLVGCFSRERAQVMIPTAACFSEEGFLHLYATAMLRRGMGPSLSWEEAGAALRPLLEIMHGTV